MTQRNWKSELTFYAKIFRDALRELNKNDPLRMAGATAFFTTFALPPIMVILIQSLGLVFGSKIIRLKLFQNLTTIIGKASVQQIVEVLMAFRRMAQNWYIVVIGFLFLLFVATTLFKVIKGSLNQVWKIRIKKKQGIWTVLRSRLQSILVIMVAGILFVIGLLAEGVQAFLSQYLKELAPGWASYFNSALNYIVSVVIVTLWFAILFRFLPDGRPPWKVVFMGAFLTSILFNTGKFVLRQLLTFSNLNTIYGTSASIVLLLLFVFYSSLILYYGAAFTKIWGEYHGLPVKPLPYAMHYRLTQADDEWEENK